MIEKNTLRTDMRALRKTLCLCADEETTINQFFFTHINPQKKSVIAFYSPMGSEINCTPMMNECLKRGFECVLPSINPESKILNFIPDNLPDILIVPLLAFDRHGNRLGQGGGYYDATLRHLRQNKPIIAIGLAYAQQECLNGLKMEDHDEPLDWVITPQEARKFR